MRDELNVLRMEESDLEQRVESGRQQAEQLARRIADTQAEINRVTKEQSSAVARRKIGNKPL